VLHFVSLPFFHAIAGNALIVPGYQQVTYFISGCRE
jgi:hypothetical protein